MTFKWLRGDATAPSALGDPVTGATSYALCVYDTTGLRFDLQAPARGVQYGENPVWRRLGGGPGASRLKYYDFYRTPDGIGRLDVQAGAAGTASNRVVASGQGLNLPTLPALPLAPPVVAQVLNTEGECWGASFAASDIRRNAAPASGQVAVFRAQKN